MPKKVAIVAGYVLLQCAIERNQAIVEVHRPNQVFGALY